MNEYLKQPPKPLLRVARWALPLAVLIAIGGATRWTTSEGKVAKPVRQGSESPFYELAATDFSMVQLRTLELRVPVSGTLAAVSQVTVKSKVAAQVVAVGPQEGVAVTKGQVIMRLASVDLVARLAMQQATLEDAKAKLVLAQKNEGLNQTLLQQNFISQNAFDKLHNAVELAEAAVKVAKSQFDISQRAVDDAVIRAPIDGIVSKRHLQLGEEATPDIPLLSIVDLRHLIFEAQVPASEVPRIRAGQLVAFRVEGYAEKTFNGTVERISPTADAMSQIMTVYVAVANTDGMLRAGMFAKGSFVLKKSELRPVVPLAAVRNENGKYVVDKIEAGKVISQQVELGLRSEEDAVAEVLAGLEPGAQVMIVRLDEIRPGARVKLPDNAAASHKKD